MALKKKRLVQEVMAFGGAICVVVILLPSLSPSQQNSLSAVVGVAVTWVTRWIREAP